MEPASASQSKADAQSKGGCGMKVEVIGDGNVGRAVFRELQNVHNVNEIVLVGRKPDRLRAEVDDCLDAVVLRGFSTPPA